MTCISYIYAMEKKKSNAGRPRMDEAVKKKNRAISLTDSEYKELSKQAKEAGEPGPSAYIVKKLNLSWYAAHQLWRASQTSR